MEDSPTAAEVRALRDELKTEFKSITQRLTQIEQQQSTQHRAATRQVSAVSDALAWNQLLNDALLCGVCLVVSFGITGIDVMKGKVCPQIPGWAAAAVPFNFCGSPAAQSAAAVSSWQVLFEGGSNAPVAIAVGNAEGTRTPDGGKTAAFSSHADPGNGVTNLGTFSYQHGASSPEEADQKQLTRLKGQLEAIAPDLIKQGADVRTWLNAADLLNQSPAAGQNFPRYLKECNGDVLCARTKSYEGDAPGITRNGITIEQDQRRRMDAIAKAIAANPDKFKLGAAGSSSGWINPVPAGTFTSGFGFRMHPLAQFRRCHYGIDLAAPTGTPILAAKAGQVEIAGDVGDGYGLKVVLSHPDGTKSLYAHASKLNVRQGQQVNQGDAIALVGSTGNSSGPHLHWEVTDTNGKIIDPLPVLPEPPNLDAQPFGSIDKSASAQCVGRSL